jgi:hypothetical protein
MMQRPFRIYAVAAGACIVGCGLNGVGINAVRDAGGASEPDATVVLGSDAGDAGAPPRDSSIPSEDARPEVDADVDGADSAAGADSADSADTSALYAATCAALGLPIGTQTATLYLNNDPSMAWTATCVTTNTSSKTYLPLPTGNQSSYPLGGCATPVNGSSGVLTTWSMVRFDPTTLLVDTSDVTGATSTGATYEVSGNGSVHNQYNVMMFASARSCVTNSQNLGTVNLTGTHFVVDSSQVFLVQGFDGTGNGTTMAENTTLSVGGQPAGISPCTSVSDYYTNVGGKCLKLAYRP